jgi:hypothetical protein
MSIEIYQPHKDSFPPVDIYRRNPLSFMGLPKFGRYREMSPDPPELPTQQRRDVRKRQKQTTIAVRPDSAAAFEQRIGMLRPKAAVLNTFMDMVNHLPESAVDPFLRAVERGAAGDHPGLVAAMNAVCHLLSSPEPSQSNPGAAQRPPVVGEVGRPSNGSSQRPKSRGGRPRKANHQ